MADTGGHSTHAIGLDFLEDPVGLSFYQAVRRLECVCNSKPRVGYSSRASDDPVQFCQEPALSFAPSTLLRFDRNLATGKPRLVGRFLGLLGPNGPMPLHITEYIHDRELNHDDATLARFMDVFNHRMISLFYRAWARTRQTVSHDRPGDDRFAAYIGSLFGIGEESFRKRDAVPDVAKVHFSGHLSCQTHHASGLRALLEDYFGVSTEIIEFIGQWIDLPPEYCCRLGESPETGCLGTTAVVGSRIWECQSRFRIRMGAMHLADFERLLPIGDSFKRLRDWVRNYVGDELSWEVQLVLKAEDVPPTQLGSGSRLGWTSWLQSMKPTEDSEDLVLKAG